MLNVLITDIVITFSNNNYNLSSISDNFTGGVNNSTTATYNGQDSSSITATMTSKTNRNRSTRITGITVTYTYEYYI